MQEISEPMAPANDSPHEGSMGNVSIKIPEKYWAAAEIKNENSAIARIVVYLRRPSFKPVRTMTDLHDWANNFLKPYLETDPAHRWIAVYFSPNTTGDGGLRNTYEIGLSNMQSSLSSVHCDPAPKFGLKHCISADEDGPQTPNELYFDEITSNTLTKCTTLKSTGYGEYKACSHYFGIPSLNAFAEVGYSSEEEVSLWRLTEQGVNQVAHDFREN